MAFSNKLGNLPGVTVAAGRIGGWPGNQNEDAAAKFASPLPPAAPHGGCQDHADAGYNHAVAGDDAQRSVVEVTDVVPHPQRLPGPAAHREAVRHEQLAPILDRIEM